MPDGFELDSDELLRQAPRFGEQARRLKAAVDELRASLAANPAPWGNDKAGRAFAAQFLPHPPEIQKATDRLCEGLASAGLACQAIAFNHEGREQSATIARP